MADTTVETTNAKPQEDWMARRWRPMMGWTYMVTCMFDFVIAPVLWAFLQAKLGQPVTQWRPLTLEGAGLYHMAMGAVLGVAAYGRTQEKLGGANNGGLSTSPSGATTPGLPATNPAPVTNSWGSQPLGSGSGLGSVPSTTTSSISSSPATGTPASAEVVTGFGGKPAPVIPPFPEK